MLSIYFGLLFYEREFSPEKVYSYFETEKVLLWIYIFLLSMKKMYILIFMEIISDIL